jgi:CRISPR/Cas system-associated exonuclease Cas4 (RecB family)
MMSKFKKTNQIDTISNCSWYRNMYLRKNVRKNKQTNVSIKTAIFESTLDSLLVNVSKLLA